MTIQEALDMADAMKPNMMDRAMKIRYLSMLDGMIYHEILLRHEHDPEEETEPNYTEDTDPGTVLLVPDKYAEDLYTHWLMSKIDLQNLEMDKYNKDRTLFENAYDTMHDWWNRTKMPIARHREIHI